jgi:hypothetical protein
VDHPQLPRISVVTPWWTLLSAPGWTISDSSEWQWQSMKPGATTRPSPSMRCCALSRDRSPTAVMRPSFHPTSPRKRGAPLPSMIEPPVRMQSCMVWQRLW